MVFRRETMVLLGVIMVFLKGDHGLPKVDHGFLERGPWYLEEGPMVTPKGDLGLRIFPQ